jgi:hypothetical protein
LPGFDATAVLLFLQKEEWVSLATLNLLNLMQTVIINAGLLVGSIYCGYLVSLHIGFYLLYFICFYFYRSTSEESGQSELTESVER